ncbi:unnamed protein product [Mucor hiemalis]
MFQYQSSYGVQQYKTYYSIPVMPTPCVTSSRRTGRVKFFNLSKGYGFIIPTFTDTEPNPSKQEEVFVHHTSILSANKGYLVGLNKGEEVYTPVNCYFSCAIVYNYKHRLNMIYVTDLREYTLCM